jgi:hypothetical protein
MDYHWQSSVTKARSFPCYSGNIFAITWESNHNFQLSSTHKPMDKLNEWMPSWSSTSKHTLITYRMIGQTGYHWPSLLQTIRLLKQLVHPHSLRIKDSTQGTNSILCLLPQMMSMTAMHWQHPKPYPKSIVTYVQKSTEPITDTKTMQTNIDYHPRTTNPGILSGSMPGIGRLIAHHETSTTNSMAYSKY